MTSYKLKKVKQPQIGKLICELRQELGLTQEELAVSLGVAFSTINRWENERANPSPVTSKLIEIKLTEIGAKGEELLKKYCS